MPIPLTGAVGVPAKQGGGSTPPVAQGFNAEALIADLHGKYYTQTYNGTLFWATMTGGVILPAPGATAANPMTLANPGGSGKNLVLVEFDMVITTIPGTPLTGLYGLYVNNNPAAAAVTGTAITAQSGLIGASPAVAAKAFSTSTVPAAPNLLIPFGNKVTGEVATVVPDTGLPAYHLDLDGKVALAPGTSITPQQTVADTTNASVLCTFAWYEVAA